MKYHLVINNSCNLSCKYCHEMAFDDRLDYFNYPDFENNIPFKINFDINYLLSFLREDKDPFLVFYGGEPLLSFKTIEEIIQKIDFPCKLGIQTNGTLLNKLSKNTLERLDVILVSIDGDKETNDYFRKEGTFDKIIENLKNIIEKGYSGRIIARMTIMEGNNFYDSVRFLLDNPYFSFKEIHWQLNANFYPDYNFRSFKEWSKDYCKDIYKLTLFWKEEIKKGNVIMLYPFVGIIKRLMDIKEGRYFGGYYLHCGAGHSNFSIQSDGKIIPCPIMIGIKGYYLGDIFSSNVSFLKNKKVPIKGICLSCSKYKVCGGRCLYSNIIKPWKEEDLNLLCNITKETITSLENLLIEIEQLIEEGRIKKDDFNIEEYFGPEIIP